MKSRLLAILCAGLFAATATMAQRSTLSARFDRTQAHQGRQAHTAKTNFHEDTPDVVYRDVWDVMNSTWDSISRDVFTYFLDGREQTGLFEPYNGSGYDPGSRTTFTYSTISGNGTREEQLFELWNGTSWDNYSRTILEYDAQGNETHYIYELWNGTGYDTTYASRSLWTYNGSNVPIEWIGQDWQQGTGFTNSDRETYSLNAAQEWDTLHYAAWDGTQWLPYGRFVDIVWHDFAGDWAERATSQTWNGNGYDDFERFSCTFGMHSSSTCIYEQWTAGWDTTGRSVQEIDLQGHSTLFESFEYQNGNYAQTSGQAAMYTYDGQGRTTELISQWWDTTGYVNSNRWTIPSFFVNRPEPIETTTIQLRLYPNPAVEEIFIEGEIKHNTRLTLTLYDLQGRKRMVSAMPYRSGTQCKVRLPEAISSGTYVYELHAGTQRATGKLILRR